MMYTLWNYSKVMTRIPHNLFSNFKRSLLFESVCLHLSVS